MGWSNGPGTPAEWFVLWRFVSPMKDHRFPIWTTARISAQRNHFIHKVSNKRKNCYRSIRRAGGIESEQVSIEPSILNLPFDAVPSFWPSTSRRSKLVPTSVQRRDLSNFFGEI